jgi:hypothetical protein
MEEMDGRISDPWNGSRGKRWRGPVERNGGGTKMKLFVSSTGMEDKE